MQHTDPHAQNTNTRIMGSVFHSRTPSTDTNMDNEEAEHIDKFPKWYRRNDHDSARKSPTLSRKSLHSP